MQIILLAFLSGLPALVYEVVWTREIALLAGGGVEATAVVLASFFGGLALGARWLGSRVDQVASPLRAYARFEAAAAGLALVVFAVLRLLGHVARAWEPERLLVLSGALLVVAAFPLGGTIPALLRAAEHDAGHAARTGGLLVGANTLGAVAGVVVALFAIPQVGLKWTLLAAAAAGAVVAGIARILSRAAPERVEPEDATEAPGVPAWPPFLAAIAGVATLAYEVLIARMAAIQIGSSLVAWALTLALFLLGLAAGNLAASRRAAATPTPERDLAWVESAAVVAIGIGAMLLAPGAAARPSSGSALSGLVVAVLPPALLMGAAFPFFVRLTAGRLESLGRAFGTVSATNTAGGVVGSLLAPFVLLPALGLVEGALACAALNAAVAIVLLGRRVGTLAPFGALVLAAVLAFRPPEAPEGMRLIFVSEGPQATTAVVRDPSRRDLVVNGEAHASTYGTARTTEEFLVVLPAVLHANPERFLEVGFGSGITLGMATEFPFTEIACAEIAGSVLEAAPYFRPENRDVAGGHDFRVRIERRDGRVLLARRRNHYDIVVLNTVHPWSVGATRLYSREYFTRVSSSLRAGGIVAQWLPLERTGAPALTVILRTFFRSFPHGTLYWGDENVIAVGSRTPIDPKASRFADLPASARELLSRLAINGPEDLQQRAVAGRDDVLAALGEGLVLWDDRPALETFRFEATSAPPMAAELDVLIEIARRGGDDALVLWLESRALRVRGDAASADSREALAEAAGFVPARSARIDRSLRGGLLAVDEGRLDDAIRELSPLDSPDARHGRALAHFRKEEFALAKQALRGLERGPGTAPAWNLLGVTLQRLGESGAHDGFEAALAADPFLPAALANAGLEAVRLARAEAAAAYLARLRELSVAGPSDEELTLAGALGDR